MIDYYARVAAVMVPHLRGRALTVIRYPDGVTGKHFFEKRCPSHRPDWVKTARVWAGRRAGEIDFCLAEDRPTLIWLAQLAALEMHPSLSLATAVDEPTVLAFDLDPGEPADLISCCRVALTIRELFEQQLGMRCFAKTSGSKGMQVYVPLNSGADYAATRPYAQATAQALEVAHPDLIVSRMTRALRPGKVLIDWSQNSAAKTTIAAYSLRARPHPTVSTPLRWEEVESAEDPADLSFGAADVLARIAEHGDLFEPVLSLRQNLGAD